MRHDFFSCSAICVPCFPLCVIYSCMGGRVCQLHRLPLDIATAILAAVLPLYHLSQSFLNSLQLYFRKHLEGKSESGWVLALHGYLLLLEHMTASAEEEVEIVELLMSLGDRMLSERVRVSLYDGLFRVLRLRQREQQQQLQRVDEHMRWQLVVSDWLQQRVSQFVRMSNSTLQLESCFHCGTRGGLSEILSLSLFVQHKHATPTLYYFHVLSLEITMLESLPLLLRTCMAFSAALPARSEGSHRSEDVRFLWLDPLLTLLRSPQRLATSIYCRCVLVVPVLIPHSTFVVV